MRIPFWLSAAVLISSLQAATIDYGQITANPFGNLIIHISSTDGNFALNGSIGARRDMICFNCTPGASNWISVMSVSDESIGAGSLTLNGVSYPNIIFNHPSGFPFSSLRFQTALYQVTGAGPYTVPFHLDGWIQASLTAGPGMQLLLNVPIHGDGLAGFTMYEGWPGTFGVAGPISFGFVPEPASGLSLAGGLLVVVCLKRLASNRHFHSNP